MHVIYFIPRFMPAKSRTRRRQPAAQAAPSQAVHRNLATDPKILNLWYYK